MAVDRKSWRRGALGGVAPVKHGRRRAGWWVGLVALALAACGGGDGTDPGSADASVREQPATFFPPDATIPADAHQRGMWSPLYNWPLVAVHAVLMPDGRVLSYGSTELGQQTARFIYDFWDGAGAPDAGHLTLPNTTITDIFCSSQLILPTGTSDVFLAGGDNWTGTSTTNTGNNNTNIISGQTNAITPGANLNRPRWYSTSTTLINGETYIQGGYGGGDQAEIRGLDGSFRLLSPSTSALIELYPRNFVAPDGRVFGFESGGRMYFVDPRGTGTLTMAGRLPTGNRGDDATAAMFRPGRILQMGGSSNGAVVIDINSGTPVVTATQSMSSQRRLAVATLLADGKVLATGGSRVWNELVDVNKRAEIWDPQTGQWMVGPEGAVPRLYHGNALLLPDASVLVTGGGSPGPRDANGVEQNNLNAEIYFPPYLFKSGGERAARPTIQSAPNQLEIGETFQLAVGLEEGRSVSRVTLVKTGSSTHGFNMEQRFVELGFRVDGQTVHVQAPTRAGVATPGYYMVFVIDSTGVPSVASMLRIGIAGDPDPAMVPDLQTPVAQSSSLGGTASLQLEATDPNGDALSYSATGLPPGLSIDPATGLITGETTQLGSYDVTVRASDGFNTTSRSFVWTVRTPQPLEFVLIPQPSAVERNGTIAYTAGASGTNVQYRWNFGDGTPPTEWSASPETSHVYDAPGTYSVTVFVQDDLGDLLSRSFLQVVYLPATSGRPASSGNLLFEQRLSGNSRLWVVNPDNDSITGFDTVTRARLGEVPVGLGPRAIARAGTGLLWVSNRQSATLSIVDPATRTVSRTVALPRGSQPHGLVMSPDGTRAYVVLEAGGLLLEFDTSSYAELRRVPVGLNVRHVSINADGSRLYLSRFITPPLPGESTASVSTPASAGAEVLQVAVASLGIERTTVLAHSDRADFENQGRGIPNYLGAVAISPDGTQAWVPSKLDNVKRGALRDGLALNFQNTVRAVSSRIVLATGDESLAARVDHDNASLASAAVFDARGVYLFVALETSREVAIIDAHGGFQLGRIDVGRAPQGLVISPDGGTLYVHNFMDRSVGVFDLRPLMDRGEVDVPSLATLWTVPTEKLAATVLRGKQLFYDARDTRLARDRYMSCASCHSEGEHDGRTWDFTGFGEGLRNTPSLKGRAAIGQGFVHWSANFDEIQDFEGQIRSMAGGTGLMANADFNAGTRSTPLGDAKAGLSSDLDALAAYVASLNQFDPSPLRASDGTLTAAATAGKAVFTAAGCASCHNGAGFTGSAGASALKDVGTIKPSSGQRLGSTLSGLDVPTLRDVWKTAPYLHDGSAATLGAAVQAHAGTTIGASDLANLAAYLQQIGSEEPTPLTFATTLPANAVFCASERGTCTIPAGKTASVWFGAGNRWLVRPGVSGSLVCASWVLGDPSPGVAKSCRYVVTSGTGANQPPTVSLTAPANNASVAEGTTIALSATAADAGGAIARVEFRDGATLLATDETAPFSFSWTGAAAGAHSLTATAVDDEGATTVSTAVDITVTTVVTPPSPPANAGFCAAERATCTIPTGATATVWFGVGSTWAVRTGVTGSIVCAGWVFGDPAPGLAKSCRFVITAGGAANNQPPTVSLTAPASGSSVVEGTPITLAATAADSDGSVTRVEFYDGTTLLATANAAPFSAVWSGAAVGAHSLTAVAYDNQASWTTSAAVSLTVTAPTSPPTPPANAAFCASERGTCTIASGATASVWFGAGTTWAVRHGVTGSIVCATWIFGDPLPGSSKSCRSLITAGGVNNTPPSVSMTAPADGATVAWGTPVTLTATASDTDGTIARVEFRDGTALLATVTAAPYTFEWTGAAAGAHSLTATAIDNAGGTTTSAAVALTVSVPASPPPGSIACAAERATCTIPAGRTATVWFGTGTTWAARTGVSGSIVCANWVFGDPAPGVAKSCLYQ